jgi:hypothetical protein
MEYTIKSVKKGNTWNSPYGDMQSYTLSLDGVGEPVVLNKKVPVKQEPKEGETLYGTLEEKTNQKGNAYMKFTAVKPPEATGQAQSSNWHESPEKQQSINRAVALNNAVVTSGVSDDIEKVLEIADAYFAWLTNEEIKQDVKEELETQETISLSDIPF